MTDDESKRVIFGFDKKKLTLRAQGTESGRSRVELPLDYDGKAVEIGFDPKFVLDMLRVLPPDAALTVELNDSATPSIFRYDPDYLYVVVPLSSSAAPRARMILTAACGFASYAQGSEFHGRRRRKPERDPVPPVRRPRLGPASGPAAPGKSLGNGGRPAIGPAHPPLGIRRGVMEIEVDNAVLMQELAMFQKRKLLARLRELLKGTTLNDLKFKAGNWQSG